ncbi:MAG: dockerin type I domain-containing protein, partial [Terriglobia bacterium]
PGRKGQPGDVNNDGRVNNTDSAMIVAVLDGVLLPDIPPAINFTRSGDINRDGRIDRTDAFTIQGVVVGTVSAKRK